MRKIYGVFAGLSLQTKMLSLIVPVLLLFFGATLTIYDQTRQTLKHAVITGSEHNFNLIVTEWNTKMQEIKNNANRLASNKYLKQYLDAAADHDSAVVKNELSNQLFNLVILSECLQSAFISRSASDYLSQTPFQYDSGAALMNELYAKPLSLERFFACQTSRGVYFCYIQTLSSSRAADGPACLVLVLKPDYARTLIRKYGGSNIEYYVASRSGDLFYSTPAPGVQNAGIDLLDVLQRKERIIETQRNVIVRSELYGSSMQLVAAVSKRALFENIDRLQLSYVLSTAAAFTIILLLIFGIFRSFSQRVKSLNSTMATVADGNYTARCRLEYGDEAGQLAGSLNGMLDNLQSLVIDVSLKEIELKRAQLDVIKSQNSPHFLYNTLETIRMISLRSGDKIVPNIIKQLSRMMRYSTESRQWVTVAQEIEQIARYLDIQKLRFKEKFTADIDMDPGILDCEILKLILQPLVENAFKHGIEPKDGPALLTIQGRRHKAGLLFDIVDTGVGMEPSTLRGIKDYIENRTLPDAGMGIGLKNVIDRLWLHFPESGGLEIDSAQGVGTSIRLLVPEIAGGGNCAEHHAD